MQRNDVRFGEIEQETPLVSEILSEVPLGLALMMVRSLNQPLVKTHGHLDV